MARDHNAQNPPVPTEPPGGMTAPIVTGINPMSGAAGGGETVAVTGTGFTGATSVLFGSVPGTNLTVVSDTQLTVTSPPPRASGTVDVTVTAPAGTSATSAADQFTYEVSTKVPQQPRTAPPT
jgi:IPT/TIG domain